MRLALALLPVCMLMGSARADDALGLERRPLTVECDEDTCTVGRADLEALARANQSLGQLVERAVAALQASKERIEKLESIKGCGKLEVLPKPAPRKPPPGGTAS